MGEGGDGNGGGGLGGGVGDGALRREGVGRGWGEVARGGVVGVVGGGAGGRRGRVGDGGRETKCVKSGCQLA